jgi:hypothetical protein
MLPPCHSGLDAARFKAAAVNPDHYGLTGLRVQTGGPHVGEAVLTGLCTKFRVSTVWIAAFPNCVASRTPSTQPVAAARPTAVPPTAGPRRDAPEQKHATALVALKIPWSTRTWFITVFSCSPSEVLSGFRVVDFRVVDRGAPLGRLDA